MTSHQQYVDEIKRHINTISGNIPLHRRESKRTYSFSKAPFEEQLAIWDLIWNNNRGFYPRVHAFFFLERHMRKTDDLKTMWPVIIKWQDAVDDWGLCDSLSKIYTRILEILPEQVYLQLQEWNTDTDLWKRRQSVVSLLYYSRTKKQYLTFGQITSLITPLLGDNEYYVQKGVGWALRELHNVYPQQALEYLKCHSKHLSGIAIATAVEKMEPGAAKDLRVMRRGLD